MDDRKRSDFMPLTLADVAKCTWEVQYDAFPFVGGWTVVTSRRSFGTEQITAKGQPRKGAKPDKRCVCRTPNKDYAELIALQHNTFLAEGNSEELTRLYSTLVERRVGYLIRASLPKAPL